MRWITPEVCEDWPNRLPLIGSTVHRSRCEFVLIPLLANPVRLLPKRGRACRCLGSGNAGGCGTKFRLGNCAGLTCIVLGNGDRVDDQQVPEQGIVEA
jgi:hypothetical protein